MEPVRYAVGDTTLVRVPYVDIVVPAETVGITAEQVRAQSWADPVWTDGDQVRVAAAVWIIEADGKTIVVDPTPTADDILRGDDAVTHQEAIASLLAAAGYPRESIDVAIASHIDGIGMLVWRTEDGWGPTFPNAPLLISSREADAILDDGPYEPSGGEAFRALHEQGVVTPVGDEHPVTPSVTIEWTRAHSPGHSLVTVESNGERASLIGHLALNPVHCLIPDGQLHADVPAAYSVLRGLADGRLLAAPLWPTPGAIRWTGDTITVADPAS
jgi:glyoxylase-like metal-dependent hydrolase (beta-lactamase superfamily II)